MFGFDRELNHIDRVLTIERLKTFGDSVPLVAITVLAYNLVPPSFINGEMSD